MPFFKSKKNTSPPLVTGNSNLPTSFHDKKPGRWKRFKNYVASKFSFRENPIPETPERVIEDFSSQDIDDTALDVFGAPGSKAALLLDDLKEFAGSKVGVNVLLNIVSQVSKVIESRENEYLQASKNSRDLVLQKAFDGIDYKDNFLTPAIRYCVKNEKVSKDDLHNWLGPLINIHSSSDGLKYLVTIGPKELRAAIDNNNHVVFNYLSDVIKKQITVQYDFNHDMQMILKYGLPQIVENMDVLDHLMVDSKHISDCAKYVAGLDLGLEQTELQLKFISKCVDLASAQNPSYKDIILTECVQMADNANFHNGKLATMIVESSDSNVLATLPQAIEFIARHPSDSARKRIFHDLVNHADFNSAGSTMLQFLTLSSDAAVSGVKSAIKSGTVDHNDMMVMLYSRVNHDVKSECLAAYIASSEAIIEPKQKVYLLNAALDNGINQSVVMQIMNRFANTDINEGLVVDFDIIKRTTQYLRHFDKLPFTGMDTSKVLVAAVDLVRRSDFDNVIKENPSYFQAQFDDLLKNMPDSGILCDGTARLIEFATSSGLSLDNYLNNIANKFNSSLDTLSRSDVRSPGLLKPETLMHFIGRDSPDYIQNLSKVVLKFADKNSIKHDQFLYVLFTPHDTENFVHKMRVVTAMIEVAPESLNRNIFQSYIQMMMAVDDKSILKDAVNILDKHQSWISGELSESFREHFNLVRNDAKEVTMLDLERYVSPLYQKYAEEVNSMNAHFSTGAREEYDSIFVDKNFIAEELQATVLNLVGAESLSDIDSDLSSLRGFGSNMGKRGAFDVNKLIGAGSSSENSAIHHEPIERLINQIKNPLYNVARSVLKFDDDELEGNMVIPGKEYSLNVNDRDRIHEAQKRLQNIRSKLTIVGAAGSMENNIVEVANELLSNVLNVRSDQITKNSFDQLMEVVDFTGDRILQVYGVVYEPLAEFLQNITHNTNSLITESVTNENSPNFLYGREGMEIAEAINGISDIMLNPEYKNIRYATAQPIASLAEVAYSAVSGDIKLTKEGGRNLIKLLNDVLRDVKQMSGFVESEISTNLQELTNKVFVDSGKKVALHDSHSKQTRFVVDVGDVVSPYVDSVLSEHLHKISILIKSLEKQTPLAATAYADLHNVKRFLSNIIKDDVNDTKIINSAKALKSRVTDVMHEAKGAGTMSISALNNMKTILSRVEHAKSLQEKDIKCRNFAAKAGSEIEKISEISSKMLKEPSYLVNKKLSKGLNKAVANFASEASVIGGNTSFPAHTVVAKVINHVSAVTDVANRSNDIESIDLMREHVDKLTVMMKNFQKTSKDFAVPFVDKSNTMSKNLTNLSMPPLPGMFVDGPGKTNVEQNQLRNPTVSQQLPSSRYQSKFGLQQMHDNQLRNPTVSQQLPSSRYQSKFGLQQMHDMNNWILGNKDFSHKPLSTPVSQSSYLDRLQNKRQYSSGYAGRF